MLEVVIQILSTLGVAGLLVLLLRHYLTGKRETQTRQIESDRATYDGEVVSLIRVHIDEFVRRKYLWDSEESVRRNNLFEKHNRKFGDFLYGLYDGNYEHFVDKKVDKAWVRYVEALLMLNSEGKTPELLKKYADRKGKWLVAARRSFGPLPEDQEEK